MKKKILQLENVGYRYHDALEEEYVLRDLNYSFETGKIYAIKGKSGSGKTTLLSLLSGLEHPTSGTIYYQSENLEKKDLDHYRSHDIGIVFQSYNLLPHLSAVENIVLSMDISNIRQKDKKQKAIELMRRVGLTENQASRRVLCLSGGEQQRIAIARSLSYQPQIILADEPTGNLDKETEMEILKIFDELAHKENKCVIIVTHSKNVCDQADKVYELPRMNTGE